MANLEFRKLTRKDIITNRIESLSNTEIKTLLAGMSQESLRTLEKLFPEAVIFNHLIQLKTLNLD